MPYHQHIFYKSNKGVSLVELAIVVLIIGLVLSMVLTGKTMMRQAGLRGIINEVSSFRQAIQLFKHQYGSIPGDISNATDFWPNTTNGNGNQSYRNGREFFAEGYKAWQHLSLAGLIPGKYDGIKRGNRAIIGKNVPRSKLSGGGYSLIYDNRMNSSRAPLNKNMIRLGAEHPHWNTSYGLISPSEAMSIDVKIDDGKPDRGAAYTDAGFNKPRHACSNGQLYPRAKYAATQTEDRLCMMQFMLN